jgi:hypothetical protein
VITMLVYLDCTFLVTHNSVILTYTSKQVIFLIIRDDTYIFMHVFRCSHVHIHILLFIKVESN